MPKRAFEEEPGLAQQRYDRKREGGMADPAMGGGVTAVPKIPIGIGKAPVGPGDANAGNTDGESKMGLGGAQGEATDSSFLMRSSRSHLS